MRREAEGKVTAEFQVSSLEAWLCHWQGTCPEGVFETHWSVNLVSCSVAAQPPSALPTLDLKEMSVHSVILGYTFQLFEAPGPQVKGPQVAWN